MRKEKSDSVPRERIVRLLLLLAEKPYQFKAKDLAERFEESVPIIKGDIAVLRNIGFNIGHDHAYRYAIRNQQQFEALDNLLLFSVEEQYLLRQAIATLPIKDRKKEVLSQKLASTYDFRQLGHQFLREPYLEKIDQLNKAITEKKQAVIVQYQSSNSNTVRDRTVEPFKINAAEDTVQCYEPEKGDVAHFRISRIEDVRLTDTPWAFEPKHKNRSIDPFRIVEDNQVMVVLYLKLAAKNELVERFPSTAAHITPFKDKFHFQCPVNAAFYGLSNFILGHHKKGDIEIVSPESLREHLSKVMEERQF
jgi:predicted DNA-binding transcriptional regulator YafY